MDAGMGGLPFPPRLTGPLAITHATVVPMDTERLLPDHTVVIEDGRIRTLAPSGSVDVTRTPGVQVVDGTGKYLLPGLADMHAHYWDPGVAALYLANGVTLVRNMWGAPFHLALRRQVQEGRLPGPRIVTTTPIIDGPDQHGRTCGRGDVARRSRRRPHRWCGATPPAATSRSRCSGRSPRTRSGPSAGPRGRSACG